MLAGIGAVLGLFVAGWGSALLVGQIATPSNFVAFDLTLDWRVLAFTAAIAVATSLIFGLAPALGVSRIAPHEAIKAEGRGIIGDRRFGIRNVLVVGQIALSLALVVAAALFVRTLTELVRTPLGFDADRLLVASIDAPDAIGEKDRNAFYGRLREAASAMPGVEHAGVSILTPVGTMRWNTNIEPSPDVPEPPKKVHPWVNSVQPGWFRTFGTPLVQGRDFTDSDRASSARVTIVNQSFVKTYFAGLNPIGKRVKTGIAGPRVEMLEIVGVAADTVYRSLRAGFEPTMYVPMAQQNEVSTSTILTVRAAAGAPEDLTRALGLAMTSVDPATTFTIRPFNAQLRAAVRQERLVAILGGFFGGLALLLATIGLYGVTSYSVSRRRGEIGIRMALGADPVGVVRLVMARVGGLMIAGVVAGGAITWWASTYVATLLFGLGPRDPVTLIVAIAILGFAGALAGWLPARRAARIDPVRVLRES
jgi:predicted permease